MNKLNQRDPYDEGRADVKWELVEVTVIPGKVIE
jgi:hypothetical protein